MAPKTIDIAAAFGAGISYPVRWGSFFVEGRYLLGLTDTVKGGTINMAAGGLVQEVTWDKKTDTIKNRGFHLMAGVIFPLGS